MDAISYSYADKQAKRIKKFNENPDSASGILTQPSVIQAGEIVSIPAGRTAVMANTVINGTVTLDGTMFIPTGSSVDFSNGIKVNGTNIALSIPTSYHLLQGSLSVSNEVITNGFSTTLYTGNGTTQSVVTGIDMSTQWGNDVSETFGGLVWLKDRVTAAGHVLSDTIRGINKYLQTNNTSAETTLVGTVTSFNNDGFSVGNQYNINLASAVSWNFQTTHRRTGVTNHGKNYTEHYNPFTGFTIIKYEGSGLAGHEIPHSLGRKLGFVTFKNLNGITNWQVHYNSTNRLELSTTGAQTADCLININNTNCTLLSDSGTNLAWNGSTNQYIMYGWANSYLDKTNKLIGNYEIGVYQGTGVAGNKVTTRGKPAWIMLKRLDSADGWYILDNQRSDKIISVNTFNIEGSGDTLDFLSDGFVLKVDYGSVNASGGQYLYMVVYDNDSVSGKSKYPKATDTSNVQINNALIPLAKGIDSNGAKNNIVIANETITGLTYTAGKNYLYRTETGYGVKSIQPSYGKINPLIGDFYNVITNKWYSNTNVEITESRNYLNHIVHADQNGQVTYVEELPKIEYKDIIKANEYQGKNACTAWVNFDGATTPPIIRDSYNVSAVIRNGTGDYDVYFSTPMDNTQYSVNITSWRVVSYNDTGDQIYSYLLNKCKIRHFEGNTNANSPLINVQVFGGRN